VLRADVAQVDQIASLAISTLGGLWSGVTRGLQSAGQGLSASGMSEDVAVLRQVAAGSLASLLQLRSDGGGGGGSGRGGKRDMSDPETFEDFFELYGGLMLVDELSASANAAAHSLNRARCVLQGGQRAALDAAAADLGALFERELFEPKQLTGAAAADGDASVASWTVGGDADLDVAGAYTGGDGSNGGTGAECWDRLCERYSPVEYLVGDSLARVAASLAQLEDAELDVSGGSGGDRRKGCGPEGAAVGCGNWGDCGGGGGENHARSVPSIAAAVSAPARPADAAPADGPTGDGAMAAAQRRATAASAVLARLQPHAAKRLAELAAAQLQMLADIGHSLTAPARIVAAARASGSGGGGGVPGSVSTTPCETAAAVTVAAGGGGGVGVGAVVWDLPWPDAPAEQAELCRRIALRMAHGLARAAGAYAAAAAAAASALGRSAGAANAHGGGGGGAALPDGSEAPRPSCGAQAAGKTSGGTSGGSRRIGEGASRGSAHGSTWILEGPDDGYAADKAGGTDGTGSAGIAGALPTEQASKLCAAAEGVAAADVSDGVAAEAAAAAGGQGSEPPAAAGGARRAQELVRAFAASQGSAAVRLREAYRSLLYCILLRTLVRDVAT